MANQDTFFTGCMPALMTPCNENGTPDFAALVRKGQELIEVGMKYITAHIMAMKLKRTYSLN